MTLAVRAVFWVIAYLGAVVLPLVFAAIGASRPDHGFWDALLQFHRQIGYVGLAFILVHFAISARWNEFTPAKAVDAPALVWFGMVALLSLVALIASSVWRRRLRLSYETWHITHTVLALVLIVGALGHVFFNRYLGIAVGECLGYLFTGAWTILVGIAMLRSSAFDAWLAWPGIAARFSSSARSSSSAAMTRRAGTSPARSCRSPISPGLFG